MIKPINSQDDITKVLRSTLIEQSELDPNNVMNGLSVRGPDLVKFLEEDLYEAYEVNDVCVIFELNHSSSGFDMNDRELGSNTELLVYTTYSFDLTIYGNKSDLMAVIIKSRFESEEVRNSLKEKGIHLIEIGDLASNNEYINETLWRRSDLSIRVAVRYNIEKKKVYDDYLINSLEIIKRD